ncbi:MAG: acetate kinase [Waterburya sp.]
MMVLVLNAGSSSQKSCLYSLGELLPDTPTEPLWAADIDWTVADDHGLLTVKSNDIKQEHSITERDTALEVLLKTLIEGETRVLDSFEEIDLVGHRVVHGGAKYSQPILIDVGVKDAIADFIPLAPNHNPAHLAGIETIEALLPNVPQVAVFDTAFHTTIPEPAKVYPLPYEWYEQGIQRHGFHGISHQYCAHRAAQILHQPLESLKIITCHLGNGCSLAAIKDGICVDTTMGFSPLEGLMMGTRCGSIDPQIPLYLMQEHGLNVEAVNRLLNKESGLKGVSGISGDMREINQAIAAGNQRASLALNIYLHRLKSSIGAMVASLNGLDVLVFTGGVGENNAIVRERTCEGLTYLGLQLDLAKNHHHPVDRNIATDNSPKAILVIHTQEDWAIALAAASTVA